MKLTIAIFATILSLASPSFAVAVESNHNKQGTQLRGGARNAMAVTEQELGNPQEERSMTKNIDLDEVIVEEFDDEDEVDDDDFDEEDDEDDDDVVEEEDDEDDTDEMQSFIDFVNAKDVSGNPAQKKTVVAEEDDDDDVDEEDDDDVDEEDDEDEDNPEELQAFIDFVNAKEKIGSQQKKAIAAVEEDEDDEDADDDVYFSDETPERRTEAVTNEQPNQARALGHHGKKCYWYHGYKRCYYSNHKKHHYGYGY